MKAISLLSLLSLVAANSLSSLQSQAPQPIAAVVGDHEISIARVKRHLKSLFGNEKFDEPLPDRLLAESLEHLIRRHVVFHAVKRDGVSVGDGELRLEIEKLKDRLEEIDLPLHEYLASKKTTMAELEYEFSWRMAWQKYLEKHLTPEQLSNYFKKHRRQFDGTEMHVAHLLFASFKEDANLIRQRAAALRQKIQAGKINWEEAVRQYSDAPTSSDQGGEIGWLSYEGPMPHEFCEAAMKLNVGEISPPVQTVYGIHLIKCLEIRPGKAGPRDVARPLRQEAAKFLFDSLSEKGRKSIRVEYKVAWPKPAIE